jgi:hypothetical protein
VHVSLQQLNGLFIGQLTEEELVMFDKAVKDGLAERDYTTPAGFFLGLGKVKIYPGDGDAKPR